MKTQLLKCTIMLVVTTISFVSCDDDEKPKTAPVVTTGAVSNVTTTTAAGGGEITSDGNAKITVSGLVYSSTNATPTIADSKTEETATSGAFTSTLEGLTSGTTYHVRAYATNSVGTGYGAVVDFATGNAAPTATNVLISGTVEVNKPLTATYTYNDAENNTESGSTFQWYIATDATGTSEEAIAGATTATFIPLDVHEFKFIRVGVTPKAGTGNVTGVEVKSSFSGPIAVRTTVTFTYNNAAVTYGVIISPVTGKKWLDRNLGAPNAPSAWDDWANFGDLFQWGRAAADGHQLINRAATQAATTAVNGTTTTQSATDSPVNSLFILPTTGSDWRTSLNNNLWQGVNGINNPCPSGWRIPTKGEWEAENLDIVQDAYTQLKITIGGQRSYVSGGFVNIPYDGYYWSSTILDHRIYGFKFEDGGTGDPITVVGRATGYSCRCIKD